MKTIFKYELRESVQQVEMPQGAKILTVQVQSGRLCLWAEVDEAEKMVERKIEIFGTGHPMSDECRVYIGTVQFDGLVWHVYEAK